LKFINLIPEVSNYFLHKKIYNKLII